MLNFPSSPALNDEYTYSGTTYVWDGVKWVHEALTLAAVAASGSHADLLNRTAADSHSIAAITGLQSALDGKLQPNVDISTGMISATKTTEQLRLAYDATKYASITVNSLGRLSVDPSGGVILANAPSGYWGTGTGCYAIGDSTSKYGQLGSEGSYELSLTANGCRNTGSTWTSYAAGTFTGASQIRLSPQGFVSFAADSTKSTGSAVNPTDRMRLLGNGDFGIGTIAPSARVHVISTTEQLRLGYDATKYASMTVNSTGDLTIVPTGTLAFGTWTSNADAAVNGYITIKSADGTTRKLATIA